MSDDEISELKNLLSKAVNKLYEENPPLIDEKRTERPSVFRVGVYLNELLKRSTFKDLHLDCEYNNNERDVKKLDNKKIVPDLIIHKRGTHEFNKLVVEFKGWWESDSSKDVRKLKGLTANSQGYKYLLGAFVKLGKENVEYYHYFRDGKCIDSDVPIEA